MNYINLLFLYGSLTLLAACKGHIACQSPPQTLLFSLNKTTGENVITTTNADKVAIRYFRNGQVTLVNDIRVQAPNYWVESLDMLTAARQAMDTTRFYVSIDDKPQGIVQLKTYVDNSPCDGWTHIGELRFNGRVIPYNNLKPGYTLVP